MVSVSPQLAQCHMFLLLFLPSPSLSPVLCLPERSLSWVPAHTPGLIDHLPLIYLITWLLLKVVAQCFLLLDCWINWVSAALANPSLLVNLLLVSDHVFLCTLIPWTCPCYPSLDPWVWQCGVVRVEGERECLKRTVVCVILAVCKDISPSFPWIPGNLDPCTLYILHLVFL